MLTSQEMLAVDSKQALRFFFERLKDLVDGDNIEQANEKAVLYNASILAHFAKTSVYSTNEFPANPLDVSDFFDMFVMDRSQTKDPEISETAASHCLMFSGFFRDQIRHRHNHRWYASLGISYFRQAAERYRDHNQAAICSFMSQEPCFTYWRRTLAALSRQFREGPLLIHRRIN